MRNVRKSLASYTLTGESSWFALNKPLSKIFCTTLVFPKLKFDIILGLVLGNHIFSLALCFAIRSYLWRYAPTVTCGFSIKVSLGVWFEFTSRVSWSTFIFGVMGWWFLFYVLKLLKKEFLFIFDFLIQFFFINEILLFYLQISKIFIFEEKKILKNIN